MLVVLNAPARVALIDGTYRTLWTAEQVFAPDAATNPDIDAAAYGETVWPGQTFDVDDADLAALLVAAGVASVVREYHF